LCFQGTLVALAAFSEGRVVDQLKSAALLTPVAYLAHITTPIGILLAKAFVGEVTYSGLTQRSFSFLPAANSALI
jgi:lysosomal acid lipase/cholesteryl ester hydrolase